MDYHQVYSKNIIDFYDNPVLHQQNYTQQSKELVSRVIAITKLLKEKYSHNQELLIN